MSKWEEKMKELYPGSVHEADILAEAISNLNLGLKEVEKKYDPESIIAMLKVLKKEDQSYSEKYKEIIIDYCKKFKEINELYKNAIL